MTLPRSDAPDPHGAGVTRDVEIINKKGLHARASAKFVQHAEKFDAAIISPVAAKPSVRPRSWV